LSTFAPAFEYSVTLRASLQVVITASQSFRPPGFLQNPETQNQHNFYPFNQFKMKNIFVSNLSFRINDDDLKQAFADYGEVNSAKVIKDNFSGRSRGFGFVEMKNDEEADKAIEELNNAEFDGKVMTVSVARPKTDRKPGGFRDNNRPGGSAGGFKKRF
jgi:RNA recognition motif-containing protein